MKFLLFLSLPLLFATFSIRAEEPWVLGPEKRLPSFDAGAELPGTLVKTWSFDKGVESWRPRSKTVEVTHDSSNGHNAPGSLRVRGYDTSAWNFVWSPTFVARKDRAYQINAWIRVESQPENAPEEYYFKAEASFADGNKQFNTNRVSSSVSGKWELLSTRVSVDSRKTLKTIAVVLEKGGKTLRAADVLIDDVSILEIADDWEEKIWKKMNNESRELPFPVFNELRGVHPRLLLSRRRLQLLREYHTAGKWKPFFDALIKNADTAVRIGPPKYEAQVERRKENTPGNHEQLWQRGVGNRMPNIALAWLITGKKDYLESVKIWIHAALDYPTWGIGRMDGLDLAAGHLMTGIGLSYDWIYNDLTPGERQAIRAKLTPRAARLAKGGFSGKAWWHRSYMQNHQWVSLAGMSAAAFAIADEEPKAIDWLCVAHKKFVKTLEILGDDGASHEGYGYWEYGSEYIMRYLEMADTCLGINLYVDSENRPQPWLFRNPSYALHLAFPESMWNKRSSVADFGDCPRYHWYGPSHLLRNLARRYPNSPWAATAQWQATAFENVQADREDTIYLDLCWYDESIPEKSPAEANLPLLHHFKDLDIVSARSSWNGPATHLLVKAGPPLGHKHCKSRDYGAGHVHPDVGHFIFSAGGEILFRDSGYTNPKRTGNHSVLLVDGQGQKGEGRTWFAFADWTKDRRAPSVRQIESDSAGDRILCELAPAYPRKLGLETFDRSFLFNRRDRLQIDDTVVLEAAATLEWRLQLEGLVEKISENEWRTTKNAVSAMIRVEGDIPLEISAGNIEIDQHTKAKKRNALFIRSKAPVSAAKLNTTITVIPPEK